jgi:O-antigen/teichoic acid export membrane protein
MIALQILLIALFSIFGMLLFLFIAATILDYYYYKQRQTFYELQRDYNKPRKPVAK